MKKYKVYWYEKTPVWGEVEAESKSEAIQKAKDRDFIAGTIDSDPGDMVGSYKAEEIK